MPSISRRAFIARVCIATMGSSLLVRCAPFKQVSKKRPHLVYRGQDSEFLHVLRESRVTAPDAKDLGLTYDCLIVGGGVSGLSALYHLEKRKRGTYALFEAQQACGGNAQYGKNQISSFPYGAHYLPVPNSDLKELIDFLEQCGICTRRKNEVIYNPAYLVHHPETKIRYRGNWYDGLIPYVNLSNQERLDLERFKQVVHYYATARGSDGRRAFAIPVRESSQDEKFLALDSMTCKDFLEKENIHSAFVHWYVDYGTKDDYGLTYEQTSAWAGMHYFASREAKEKEEAQESTILTWPEGNGFLVDNLVSHIQSPIHSQRIVLRIEKKNNMHAIYFQDKGDTEIKLCHARTIVSAAPHFVNQKIFSVGYLIPDIHYEYSPWLTANITISNLPKEYQDIPWDSVSFHHSSLGFVRADHQNIGMRNTGAVLTYYYPYAERDLTKQRRELYNLDLEEKALSILKELDEYYPGMSRFVDHVDFWIWGHAMTRPTVGKLRACVNAFSLRADDRALLAHSDYSGISIFEEAFYQGVRAAQEL